MQQISEDRLLIKRQTVEIFCDMHLLKVQKLSTEQYLFVVCLGEILMKREPIYGAIVVLINKVAV